MDNGEHIIPGAPKFSGMKVWFEQAAAAIRKVAKGEYIRSHWVDVRQPDGTLDVQCVYGRHVYAHPEEMRRAWHATLQETDVHKAVMAVLADDYLPTNTHLLLLEWPTLSSDNRLAYTQNERKGIAGGPRTVTTPGRYIKRHWPKLTDDYIRDVVARNGARFEMWHTPDQIVASVQQGPHSCMRWGNGQYDEEDGPHPYRVYDPDLGWRACVRVEGDGSIRGRGLVLMASGKPYVEGESLKGAVFVRTYKTDGDGGYSHSDEAMEAWLEHLGAHKECGWPEGTAFRYIRRRSGGGSDGPLMPYLDGDSQRVTQSGNKMVRDDDGEYEANNTDGSCDNDLRTCEHCDDQADEDEGIYVGRSENMWVGNCCSDEYTYVSGRSRSSYYVQNDCSIEVDGRYYDESYLEDNHIVELADGDYCHTDNAFLCGQSGDWYHNNDAVETEDNGSCAKDNTWTSEKTGLVYSDDEEPTFIDGVKMHPDEMDPDDDPDGDDEDDSDGPSKEEDAQAAIERTRAVRATPRAASATAPVTVAQAVEATSSRDKCFGAPPSVGWWCTWGNWEPLMVSNATATPLYRYWNGLQWSTDCREEDIIRNGNMTAYLTRVMGETALKAQHDIHHYPIRAPWDRAAATPAAPALHKWQECIDAQAAGLAIQLRAPGGQWEDRTGHLMFTDRTTEYRVDPDKVYMMRDKLPPSDGWWNVMFMVPSQETSFAGEFSKLENGRWVSRTHEGPDYVRTPPLDDHLEAYRGDLCWRYRRPAWTPAAVAPVVTAPVVAPAPRAAFSVGPAQEYHHENIRESVRYRAGLNGRVDVNSSGIWQLGVGKPNRNLTDPASGYRLIAPPAPPAPPAPVIAPAQAPQEYDHPNSRQHNARYRAGANGRIDVWGLTPGEWALGRGGANTDLTDPANRYEPIPVTTYVHTTDDTLEYI